MLGKAVARSHAGGRFGAVGRNDNASMLLAPICPTNICRPEAVGAIKDLAAEAALPFR
jgi:hypothetical protein